MRQKIVFLALVLFSLCLAGFSCDGLFSSDDDDSSSSTTAIFDGTYSVMYDTNYSGALPLTMTFKSVGSTVAYTDDIGSSISGSQKSGVATFTGSLSTGASYFMSIAKTTDGKGIQGSGTVDGISYSISGTKI